MSWKKVGRSNILRERDGEAEVGGKGKRAYFKLEIEDLGHLKAEGEARVVECCTPRPFTL